MRSGGAAARGEDIGELHERSDALGALRAALGAARDGHGQLILVGGEAGAGKTALLRRFARDADGIARLLWGNCDPLFTPSPLGPFLDIADQLAGEFGELVKTGAKPPRLVHALMRELAAGTTDVLIIDDLHWADEASLDLLELAGRRIGRVPALIVGSFRDDETDPAHPLRTVLGRLATAPVTRLSLAPLSRRAVALMAARHGVDGGQLFEKTGGNPFFVTEALSCGADRVPPTVRDAVLARVSRAGPGGRRLLETIAIMPSAVSLTVLEVLAGADLDYLDRCLSCGVLAAAEDRTIRFRHELARLAIEEAITPARRVALHRAALRALRASAGNTDPARLAHHAEQANDATAVLALAPAAGERAAAVGAHREAAGQYARALRFADALPVADRARLHELASYECYLSDQPERALDGRRQALAIYRMLGDRRGEGESLCWLARLLFFASRDAEADAAGQTAIEILESLPPGRELAMAYSALSHLRMLSDDRPQAIAWGERSIGLAERLGETEVLVYALNNVGTAEFSAGLGHGREKLERSLATAADAGLTEHAARAFANLASVAVSQRRYDIADLHLTDGLAFAADQGIDAWHWYLLALRARAALDRGRWAAARADAETVLGAARPDSFARLTALVVIALVRARLGDHDYWALLDEARRIALLNGHLQQLGPVAAARAEAAWLDGRHRTVAEETAQCLELAAGRGDRWISAELSCWRWRAGLADDPGGPLPAPEPFASQAADDWAAAAQSWLAIGCPYESALALADSGGEQALLRAHQDLIALGARAAAAAIAPRLRALGVRGLARGPRAATARNPAGLTARELEVLALLSADLPNADIAARLVLSTRTVEHHVSAILRKLGIASRREARAAAAGYGLAGGAVPDT
jgi:DNA-binding CsgD family transcriptional regulator/tetratricopeptide (TPR) repeat protein